MWCWVGFLAGEPPAAPHVATRAQSSRDPCACGSGGREGLRGAGVDPVPAGSSVWAGWFHTLAPLRRPGLGYSRVCEHPPQPAKRGDLLRAGARLPGVGALQAQHAVPSEPLGGRGGAVGTGRARGCVAAGSPAPNGFILLFFGGEARCPVGVGRDTACRRGRCARLRPPLSRALVCGLGGGLKLSAAPALQQSPWSRGHRSAARGLTVSPLPTGCVGRPRSSGAQHWRLAGILCGHRSPHGVLGFGAQREESNCRPGGRLLTDVTNPAGSAN